MTSTAQIIAYRVSSPRLDRTSTVPVAVPGRDASIEAAGRRAVLLSERWDREAGTPSTTIGLVLA